MRKRLTEAQFQACISGLDVGEQTIAIARGVLVLGQRQKNFVSSLGLTKGAVSQAVRRVWSAFEEKNIPEGYERVSAILPAHQAYVVRKWAAKAAQKKGASQ